MNLRGYRGDNAAVYRGGISPIPPPAQLARSTPKRSCASSRREAGRSAAPLLEKSRRMILEPDAIVPERLHKKVGWDIRHHFMAEKIIDRFRLALARNRELVRQLAVIYVLGGLKAPPEEAAPGEGGDRSRRGLAFPGASGGTLGGTPLTL
jgi:hypothetical protein